MKTTKNIARLAVTAGLTAALSFGGVMAPVTMAFAAGSSTVTFEDPDYATSTTYKGIQIFKAKVTKDNGATTASDIEWAGTGTEIKTAVVSAIRAKDKNYNSDNAQDAADWLSTQAGVTGTDSKVASDNVLSLIAANLKDSTTWKKTATGTATLSGLDAGYWLFLTDTAGKPNGKSTDAFTSPVYAMIDGASATTVKPKKSVPAVVKKILDDNKVKDDLKTVSEDEWKDVADSQIGQVVNYRLTGTIADNYATYDSYAYKFTDVLSNGLDYVDGSVNVYALNGSTYTPINESDYFVTNADASNGNTLTVEFKVDGTDKGLKDVAGVDANTQIVVFYRAKLNSSAVIAGANNELKGNPNTVTLEYSNNPMSGGAGTSAPDTVEDYTYGFKINKVDLGTEAPLKDAEFTITTNGDENSKTVKYIAADGTLSADEVVLKTGDDGAIRLTGLDAGTYTVTEKKAPNGYIAVSSFDFTITPTIKEEGQVYKLTQLDGTLNNKGQDGKVIAGLTDGKSGDNKLEAAAGTTTNDDGTFNITVGNTKQINLPLTGLNGVTFTWVAGGAVLCIGVAHLIRSRKRDDGSEE